ncbi:hypothetical protein DL93DRAFT_2053745 [Clavulina sp. PMI_390]|nr:hypothetical protein DL93DRAFT_2053745 [Clavulina sp. PMI_390]
MDTKWTPGSSYAPTLSTTDVYLLGVNGGLKQIELHPVLTHSLPSFHLVFNLANGQTGGYDNSKPNDDLDFAMGDQPATCPRVNEIHILTKWAPWITTVKASNPKRGITLTDVVSGLWATYGELPITDSEWGTLPVREQERVRRSNVNNQMAIQPNNMWPGAAFSPSPNKDRFRRADWLRDKIFFDGLEVDDDYAEKRLGFKAPNVFIMSLCA